jgi:predicted glycoside hydrolase/deacetylase ChbG (UPF0249 family)
VLIINADDWGRSATETDAAMACYRKGRITSVSAMVFMEDSERAAQLCCENELDVGLHLNFSQPYNGRVPTAAVNKPHNRIVRFMLSSKFAILLYQPFLQADFRTIYETQVEEFIRLYGKAPSHFDGHQHRHLCANMLLHEVIPSGEKVRRNFSFWPDEKGSLNRLYRRLMDKRLARRYSLTNFFFSLGQCLKNRGLGRVAELAKSANVELMTHPASAEERSWLMGDDFLAFTRDLELLPYSSL